MKATISNTCQGNPCHIVKGTKTSFQAAINNFLTKVSFICGECQEQIRMWTFRMTNYQIFVYRHIGKALLLDIDLENELLCVILN